MANKIELLHCYYYKVNISIKPGKYVIAVSGGVDSVCLLNMLSNMPKIELIVAHFDHGIRPGSPRDVLFVEDLASDFGLPFELGREKLGPSASEAQARQVRYSFLENVREKHNASAIVTAHHKDDVLETAIINLLRGTNRKGLTAILDNPRIVRPLVDVTKQEVYEYAKARGLKWVEDETNQEEKYLRNKVRKLLTETNEEDKAKLHDLILSAKDVNNIIDVLISEQFNSVCIDDASLKKSEFIKLPYDVSKEVVAHWLRIHNIQPSTKMIERIVTTIKTAQPSSSIDIDKTHVLRIKKTDVSIEGRS